MVTELPGGGGEEGGLGGSSVGIGSWVPALAVSEGNGNKVPPLVATGVSDLEGVPGRPGVEVAGPGYGSSVFNIPGPGVGASVSVICGPGYASEDSAVGFRLPPGLGDGVVFVSVLVGVGDCMLSV
jgi:hypothetical protein